MTTPLDRFSLAKASEIEVIAKCDFFADSQLWPQRQQLNPPGWLTNFRDSEKPYAISLLNAFLYYSEPLGDALYRSAAQSISAEVSASATSLGQAKALWRGFLGRLYVTYVEGERPNPSDSGFVFTRKARQVLEVDESHILNPSEAVAAVRKDPGIAILFVDDFVGSGNQMHDTWHRSYGSPSAGDASFSQLAASGSGRFYYTPLIAASKGMERLKRDCPGLRVRPAHVLDHTYCLTDPECILWPDPLRPTALEFLFQTSTRAGIIAGYQYGWKGFDDLALAVAFWHSVPDATLPLFFWEEGSWTPLIRRA